MPPFALYLIKHYFIDILERIGVNGKMNQNWSNTLSENDEKKIRVTKQHPKCTIEASYIDHHPILSGFPSWLFDPNGLDGSRFPTRMPNLTRPTRPTRPPFPTLHRTQTWFKYNKNKIIKLCNCGSGDAKGILAPRSEVIEKSPITTIICPWRL